MNISEIIESGKTVLGIELGSTRIKAVLLDELDQVIAKGEYDWENSLEDGVWTYSLKEVWNGIAGCYENLKSNLLKEYGVTIKSFGAIGVSAMMHGYLVFDKNDRQLVPFRTWRNTMTEEASNNLTKLLSFHIPQRWSIAHLYQSILEDMDHVKDINYMTTLAGYVHWKLSGCKVLGIDDASGMFPIDVEAKDYNESMIHIFDDAVKDKNYSWKLKEILPEVLVVGEKAGTLTKEGALLLDKSGDLKEGIPLCPPGSDAGTGMVATNSVKARTGNVSAGTSIFSMIVMEKYLSNVYNEIDLVTTPEGNPVAMVHCNNCTSDLNAWINIFKECLETFGVYVDGNDLYKKLYNLALKGNIDCGGLLSYNYFSGEHITNMKEGRPLFVREQNCKFNLANFMRTHLYSALAGIKIGNDILTKKENVKIDMIYGHGGFFKTKYVGQKMLSDAINTPVAVMDTASEGGAYGMAIMASYMIHKEKKESFTDYLENKVFIDVRSSVVYPDEEAVKGYSKFIERYTTGLSVESEAVNDLK